jgi:hypothetical protein
MAFLVHLDVVLGGGLLTSRRGCGAGRPGSLGGTVSGNVPTANRRRAAAAAFLSTALRKSSHAD